jgi:hypothetical protein
MEKDQSELSNLAQNLRWQSDDQLLEAEILRKDNMLGELVAGGSLFVRLLLNKPAIILEGLSSEDIHPWNIQQPIIFQLFAQYDLLGRHTLRILSIHNTDGQFRDQGIQSFLLNCLLQYSRQYLPENTLVVASAPEDKDPSLHDFYKGFFKVRPNENMDFQQTLENLPIISGQLLDQYELIVPLTLFSGNQDNEYAMEYENAD